MRARERCPWVLPTETVAAAACRCRLLPPASTSQARPDLPACLRGLNRSRRMGDPSAAAESAVATAGARLLQGGAMRSRRRHACGGSCGSRGSGSSRCGCMCLPVACMLCPAVGWHVLSSTLSGRHQQTTSNKYNTHNIQQTNHRRGGQTWATRWYRSCGRCWMVEMPRPHAKHLRLPWRRWRQR